MKKILLILFMFVFSSFLSVFAHEPIESLTQRGIVQSVEYTDIVTDEIQAFQVVKVKILTGEHKGETVITENILTGNPYYDIKLYKGAKVLLHVDKTNEGEIFSIENVQRSHILVFLSLLFCVLLIYVGHSKGVYSLISIAISCLMIAYFLSPMILRGLNPIFATILICILSTMITMYLVGGFNRKSTSAVIGCVLSIIFAGILSLLTVKVAHLSGFTGEHSLFLYSTHPALNFVAIVVSTMILATLGAVMDVAMSIASTINEIYTVDSSKTINELFKSGMNVGRDIIGTMANTLILVYLGTSLPLLLLASNIDLQKFINLEQVVTEMASALIGSSAIVICVPITAMVASRLVKRTIYQINKTLEE